MLEWRKSLKEKRIDPLGCAQLWIPEQNAMGIPWWLSRLRTQCCYCCGSGCCCGVGLIPGPGTSLCCRCIQKKTKQKDKKTQNITNWAAKTKTIYFLTVLDIGNLRSKWQKGWFLVRSLSLVAEDCFLSVSSHGLSSKHKRERERESSRRSRHGAVVNESN